MDDRAEQTAGKWPSRVVEMSKRWGGQQALLVAGSVILASTTFGGVSAAATHRGRLNPDALIVRAVNAAIRDNTARFSIHGTATAAGQSVPLTGSGEIDFTNNTSAVTISTQALGQSVVVQTIVTGGTLYLGLPQVAQVIPGKTYVSLDLTSLSQLGSLGGNSGLGNDPITALRALAIKGNTVTDLSTSTVDGQVVRGYAISFNSRAVDGQVAHSNLPAVLKQAEAQLHLRGTSVRVYLTGNGQLARISQGIAEKVQGHSVAENEVMDFVSFGTPVAITVPPPDQVIPFLQFLQQAGKTPTLN